MPKVSFAEHADKTSCVAGETLNEILRYVAEGWPVLPLCSPKEGGVCSHHVGARQCVSPGKTPLIKNWKENASLEEEKIRKWWTQWPSANVGILAGSRSRLLVVDVDGPEGEDALSVRSKLPDTLRAITSRGHHLYFRCPIGLQFRDRNWADNSI